MPKSKGARDARGQSWTLKEHTGTTRHLCPVNAHIDWVLAAKPKTAPLFSTVDYWITIWIKPLPINSVTRLLRTILDPAGLPVERYSSHSQRRSFALALFRAIRKTA